MADVLHGPAFRAYTGDDMRGAELGGAMKNVLAVATGVADGMRLGLNARAGLITRGLNEMLRLNLAIGGRPETLMGPRRPRRSGAHLHRRPVAQPPPRPLALGRGQTLDDAVREIGQVVESVQTADEVMRLAERHGVELPIAENVRDVLHGDITPAEGLSRLMAREQKAEYPQELFPGHERKPGLFRPGSGSRRRGEGVRRGCRVARLPAEARADEPLRRRRWRSSRRR